MLKVTYVGAAMTPLSSAEFAPETILMDDAYEDMIGIRSVDVESYYLNLLTISAPVHSSKYNL